MRSDFYQGMELCWAVLGAAILYFYDLLRLFASQAVGGSNFALQIIVTVLLVGETLMATLAVACLHQNFE